MNENDKKILEWLKEHKWEVAGENRWYKFSDFIAYFGNGSWSFIEYFGWNENLQMGKYDSHPFNTTEELEGIITGLGRRLI